MLGTPEEALSCLHELARPGFYILIKGSRAMQLEKIAEELINRY
jgi:UDP-N-acetylmuramyl pentapeptide synthase